MQAPSPVSLRSGLSHRLVRRKLEPACPAELELLGIAEVDARPIRIAFSLPLSDRTARLLTLDRTPEDARALCIAASRRSSDGRRS